MSDSNQTTLYYAKESSWAETPDQTATLRELPFNSETLKAEKATVQSERIRSDRQRDASVVVGRNGTGGINSEFSALNFDDFLESALQADEVKVVDIDAETCDLEIGTYSDTVTFDNTTDTVNWASTPMLDGDTVTFDDTSGTLPAELDNATTYYVVNATAGTFQLSLTKGGAVVAFTDDGVATITANGVGASKVIAAGTPFSDVAQPNLAAAQYVRIAGATDEANNGVFRLTGKTDDTLYLGIGSLTADESTVDLDLDCQYIQNGVTLHSFLIEKVFNDVAHKINFPGSAVNTLGLAMDAQERIFINMEFLSQKGNLGFGGDKNASAGDGSPVADYGTEVMNTSSNIGRLIEDGAATNMEISSYEINITNNLRARPVVGSETSLKFGSGNFDVTGTISAYFTDTTLYEEFLEHATKSIALEAQDNNGNFYGISLFALKFNDASPEIGGQNQDVFLELEIEGFFDKCGSGKTMQIDILNIGAPACP